MKKKYIKPECYITEINGENIMLELSKTGTGSGSILSNKWREQERSANSWDNIWSN